MRRPATAHTCTSPAGPTAMPPGRLSTGERRILSWAACEWGAAMRLAPELVNVADLSPDLCHEMYALMERHYDNVQRQRFDEDLAAKRWVILVREPCTWRLCGFSTQTLVDVCVDGRSVT